jgi:hypothetical protein
MAPSKKKKGKACAKEEKDDEIPIKKKTPVKQKKKSLLSTPPKVISEKSQQPNWTTLADLQLSTPNKVDLGDDGQLYVAKLLLPGNRLLLIFRCKPDNPKSRKFLGEKVRVFSAT